MRVTAFGLRTWIALSAMTVGACGVADPNGTELGKGARRDDAKTDGGKASAADTTSSSTDVSTDRVPAAAEGAGTGAGSAGTDGDGDGFADGVDCDPASKETAGSKLVDDDLSSDRGNFAPPEGFPAASWSFADAAYRQTRLVNASDVTLVTRDSAVSDVVIELRAASTEITNTISPSLRQILVLVGASVTGGQLSAIGCGIEVVEGESPTQKTSIVRLSGPPGDVKTTVLQRVSRAAVQVNEEFGIKARLSGGTLTCDVAQAATTTATASNLGAVTGSVGLFTRQTKALFKNARFCKLK